MTTLWNCSYPPNTTHRRNSQPHRPLDQYSKSRVNQDRIPPTATTGTALNRSPLPVLNPPQYSVCVVMSWRHTWLFLDATQLQGCKSSSHAKINKKDKQIISSSHTLIPNIDISLHMLIVFHCKAGGMSWQLLLFSQVFSASGNGSTLTLDGCACSV